MIGPMKRLLRSRGARKLGRDRLALASMFVIGAYLAIAIAVGVFGLISGEEAIFRIGPDQLVGAWGKPTVEQRMHYLEFYVDQVDQAFDKREPEKALAAIDFFGLRTVSTDEDVMAEKLETIFDPFDELYELQEEEGFADDPENFARLEKLEVDIAAMFQQPEGWERRYRDIGLLLGTDRQGRSILLRAVYAIKVAVQIGLVAALVSVLIGTILGGVAAFFGGWVDHVIVWLYSTLSAIPYIILLMVLAAMFLGSPFEGTLIPVYVAFCMTFWIGPCRVVRGEVMKLRELEYVQAATAVGFGRTRILLKHIIPNTTHLMFINFSLIFIGAIKAEVILSFLGLGVKNEPSWGVMINQSRQEVIAGFMWQIGAATFFMFTLVLAFNILSDALQDAFDPKHV